MLGFLNMGGRPGRLSVLTVILSALSLVTAADDSAPRAQTINGTYVGAHLSTWNQDAFLGIPFAQPPLKQLRFRAPQSIDKAFEGERQATTYGYTCTQFSQLTNVSEDCLTLNVIRPAGKPKKLLPVLYVTPIHLTDIIN